MHLLVIRTTSRRGALRHALARLKGTEFAISDLSGEVLYKGDKDAATLLEWMGTRFGSLRLLEDIKASKVYIGH